MAAAKYLPLTAAATYQHFPDWQQSPFDLSYVVEVPSGVTISYTVQYSLDDASGGDPSFNQGWTPLFVADPTNGTAQTATAHGSYGVGFAIRCLQVIVASISGVTASNPPRLAVIQGGSAR